MSILEGYIDRPALAAELSVNDKPLSERTIARYENDGLPSVTIGGRKLYSRDAVRRWLDKRTRVLNPRSE